MKIGYACINLTLAGQQIQVNRSMVRKTFLAKGITHASALALRNIIDLEKVIDWNIAHGLSFYRMSSDMFPWMSEYELLDLPDFNETRHILGRIGKKVRQHNVRLTFHPGAFNVLATSNESVLNKTIKELRQHGEIMDMLGLPRSPYAKINIHLGGAYGDKSAAVKRFIKNFSLLPPSVAQRLTIENDDKANMFSVVDLIDVHKETGIPIVFDYHHHQFCTGDLSEQDAMLMAFETWPHNINPVVHYSSSKKDYEDQTSLPQAHADYIYQDINAYGKDIDIMLEAKAKELAVLKFVKEFSTLPLVSTKFID